MANTLPFSNMLMEYPLERCCDVVAFLPFLAMMINAVIRGDFYSLFHQGLPNSIVISLGIKNREAGFCFFRDLNQFEVRALGTKKWF